VVWGFLGGGGVFFFFLVWLFLCGFWWWCFWGVFFGWFFVFGWGWLGFFLGGVLVFVFVVLGGLWLGEVHPLPGPFLFSAVVSKPIRICCSSMERARKRRVFFFPFIRPPFSCQQVMASDDLSLSLPLPL